MTEILNHFQQSFRSEFQPSSPDEYFALRLARGLGEPEAASHYAVLASKYSMHKILCAYERALSGDSNGNSAAKRFHEALARMPAGGSNGVARPKLMGVRIERRCIAVGIFTGIHLDGFRARVLSADHAAAEHTAVSFLRSSLSDNDCSAIAIERTAGNNRRSELHAALLAACRADGISVWEVSLSKVMESLSHPPPRTREAMRRQVLRMWPLPALKTSEQCALDAFATALYVQTERLFGSDTTNGH